MQKIKATLKSLAGSAPTQVFFAFWLLSAAYLAAVGRGSWLGLVTATNLFYLVLTWISVRLTDPLPAQPEPQAPTRPRLLWLQIVTVLTVILVTGLNTFRPAFMVPGWNEMVAWLGQIGESILPVELVGGPANAVANPVQYFVIPVILLLLAGARFAELGFGPGHRSWRVSAVWCVVPAIAWIFLMVTGQLSPLRVLRRLLGNTLQNGFFEEFLFRGALLTRLVKRIPASWALVAQALLFGLWHLASNSRQFDDSLLQGLAACFVSQAVLGLYFGIIFQRTRNLLAPSVVHVMVNSLGQTFG